MIKANMGLENFSFRYFSDFSPAVDDEEYMEFEMTKEYLQVIKDDLKRLVSYVGGMHSQFNKELLLTSLNNVINSILLDESWRPEEYENQNELLDIKVNDDYVMFSVFDSYYFKNVEEKHKPIRVFMSRKINGMEIYFIQEVDKEFMCISRYVISKDDIKLDKIHTHDYSFIDEMAMDKTNECVLELKRRLK